MEQKVNLSFRILFLLGVMLLFISLFLEWYTFRVYDVNNELIATWSYNILFEWSTDLPPEVIANEEFRPKNLNIHFVVNLLFIIMLVVSIYIILFKDVNSKKDDTLHRYTYILIFMGILVIFYIVIFPVAYLFPNNLYFPVVIHIELELEIIKYYSVGLGYILQTCGFIFIFPYLLYYISTITEFERSRNVPEINIENYITQIREPIDLDRFIAEEELKRGYYD